MRKALEIQILITILVISSLLGSALLTRGHNWGDDFAGYLLQAQSLVDGTPREFIQRNAFTIEASFPAPGPVAYPWGFPLLLAPALKIFGLRILGLKLINTLFYGLFLFVFYKLLRLRFAAAPALCLIAVFAFNPALLGAQDEVLSDIPFLFCSTLALYLIEKYLGPHRSSAPSAAGFAIGLAIWAAFMLRVNGLLLLGALAAAQWLHFGRGWSDRKNLSLIVLPYLTFGLLVAVQSLLLPARGESYFTNYALLTPEVLLANIRAYPELPAEMFKGLPLGTLFSILVQLFFLVGLFAFPVKNAPQAVYVFLYLGALITWPRWQGLRFVYPILPVLILIAAEGGRSALAFISAHGRPAAERIGFGLAGTLALLSLAVAAGSGWINLHNGRQIFGPFDPVSAQMFEYVREDTPPESVIVFFKPRVLRLLTDRDAFRSYSCENLSKGDYVVIHKEQGATGQVADPQACKNVSLLQVFDNRRFSVYQVLR